MEVLAGTYEGQNSYRINNSTVDRGNQRSLLDILLKYEKFVEAIGMLLICPIIIGLFIYDLYKLGQYIKTRY
jgi:hypothetical protein